MLVVRTRAGIIPATLGAAGSIVRKPGGNQFEDSGEKIVARYTYIIKRALQVSHRYSADYCLAFVADNLANIAADNPIKITHRNLDQRSIDAEGWFLLRPHTG